MKLKDYINEDKTYTKVENEIRWWVESSYKGLSIEFEPHLELVRTDEKIDFTPERVRKITEAVNIKIGDIMEKYEEEIYISEKLTLIWRNHPRFNIEVSSIEELKRDKKFLKYFKELKNQRVVGYGK